VAQTGAARAAPLAQIWMHNGMIQLDREKMAKSVGNVFMLGEAARGYGRDALVMYFCGGHYRQPVEFGEERLEEAAARVARIREAARRLVAGPSPTWSGELRDRFFDALADDFNTPAALARLFEWIREANRVGQGVGSEDLREMLDVLGLANLLQVQASAAPPQALELLARREEARRGRDFDAADQIR